MTPADEMPRRHVDVTAELTVSWGGGGPVVVSVDMGSAKLGGTHAEIAETRRRHALDIIASEAKRLRDRLDELAAAAGAVEAWDPPTGPPR